MRWGRRVLALADSDWIRPELPRLYLDALDRFFLKVQNQRNPKGKWPFGFQIVPYDIKCQIILAEAVLNFAPCIVIDCHG